MKNVKINWDIEEAKLHVEMVFPYISARRVNNEPISSYSIIKAAIKEDLNGTEIQWRNISSTANLCDVLILEIGLDQDNPDSELTLYKMNVKLNVIHAKITKEIDELINPQD